MDYESAEAANEKRMLNEIAFYYATRMTADELKTAVDFYGSRLGRKLIHTPQALTPKERDRVGQYLATQPSMVKLSKIAVEYRNSVQARREALNAAFISDFGSRFCKSLNSAEIKVSYCATSELHNSSAIDATKR
jgi:hypothetical protein